MTLGHSIILASGLIFLTCGFALGAPPKKDVSDYGAEQIVKKEAAEKNRLEKEFAELQRVQRLGKILWSNKEDRPDPMSTHGVLFAFYNCVENKCDVQNLTETGHYARRPIPDLAVDYYLGFRRSGKKNSIAELFSADYRVIDKKKLDGRYKDTFHTTANNILAFTEYQKNSNYSYQDVISRGFVFEVKVSGSRPKLLKREIYKEKGGNPSAAQSNSNVILLSVDRKEVRKVEGTKKGWNTARFKEFTRFDYNGKVLNQKEVNDIKLPIESLDFDAEDGLLICSRSSNYATHELSYMHRDASLLWSKNVEHCNGVVALDGNNFLLEVESGQVARLRNDGSIVWTSQQDDSFRHSTGYLLTTDEFISRNGRTYSHLGDVTEDY